MTEKPRAPFHGRRKNLRFEVLARARPGRHRLTKDVNRGYADEFVDTSVLTHEGD